MIKLREEIELDKYPKKEKNERDENISFKNPSMVGPIIMVLLLGGMWYLFKNYGLTEIIEILSNFVRDNQVLSYSIAFLVAVLEATVIIGWLFPGSWTILAFGVLAANGDFNIVVLACIVVLGAVVGDNVGYWLGRRYGKNIINSGFVDPLQYKMAEGFLQKHGGKSVALSRVLKVVKELVPFIAGSVRMKMTKFMFFNFIGAVIWTTLWLGAGYVFFQNLEMLEANLSKILRYVGILFLVAFVWYIYKNKHLLAEIQKDYK